MKVVSSSAQLCAKTRKSAKTTILQNTKRFFALIFTFIAVSAVSPLKADAGQATLSWSPSTSSGVTGYKLHYGTAAGSYSQSVDVGNTTSYTVSSLADGQTYYFAAVAYNSTGNQSSYSNVATVTTAALAPATAVYTISASAGAGGTISPSGAVAVSRGQAQTYTISPATGYRIASVTVDGVSVGAVASYTFSNIAANHTIAATFAASSTTTAASYTITAKTRTSGGGITPYGTTTVAAGGSLLVKIVPYTGYAINYLVVNGVKRSPTTSIQFQNIGKNYTVDAYFIRK